MKPICYLALLCLVAAQAFAQNDADDDRSELERSLSPQKLQQLIHSREQARQEMQGAGVDNLSRQIFGGFLDPLASVAIVKIDRLKIVERRYELDLSVEKVVRGNLPSQIAAQCYWSDHPWPLRPPMGAQRIKPEIGKRMLISLREPSRDGDKPDQRRFFQGMLDLNDAGEAGFLPHAQAAAAMEASAAASGIVAYEKGLTNESSAVRDLALQRLVHAKKCPTDAQCETSILAESRNLLASRNPNERMEAVMWLGELGDVISSCQVEARNSPTFQCAPVRLLLQAAVSDQNVAVGDQAFDFLAVLDFNVKENAGWCEEIVPAMRMVKRYPPGGKHIIGGSLNGRSVCLGKP